MNLYNDLKEGDKVRVLRSGSRYNTHPELAKELDVLVDAKCYFKVEEPKTGIYTFMRYISFSNCKRVLLMRTGVKRFKYYAFGIENNYELYDNPPFELYKQK
jgi:hypothetical protein